jgi:hypothetical protein
VPFALDAEPTESLAGREGVDVITRLVGIRVGVPSSERKKKIIALKKLNFFFHSHRCYLEINSSRVGIHYGLVVVN